ncbi:MAG: NfeD family protein [Candidatus Kapabacteria bacterium]|jgi:membrane protein implicated in regulation of membrane protease activity|nr:NfeD family protein [Candidatus Kapabacteria bacterium]
MDYESFLNPTLIWFLIGLVFLLLELVTPGLIALFFGIGAWVTTISCLFFDIGTDGQIVIFIASSLLSLVLLRNNLKKRFFIEGKSPVSLENEFIGKIAVVEQEIKINIPGRVSFKGTSWNATSDMDIAKGLPVEIIAKDSITLIVKQKQED